MDEEQLKKEKLKAQAELQRKKIKDLKIQNENEEIAAPEPAKESPSPPKPAKVVKLTAENLKRNDEIESQKDRPDSKQAAKKEAKPIWAKTSKELKQEEDEDINNLIEFAYELDYEQYIEDLEV